MACPGSFPGKVSHGATETASVTEETAGVSAETVSVTAETVSVSEETVSVTAEMVGVSMETVSAIAEMVSVSVDTEGVTAETAVVSVETVSVTAETVSVSMETVSVTAETVTISTETVDVTALPAGRTLLHAAASPASFGADFVPLSCFFRAVFRKSVTGSRHDFLPRWQKRLTPFAADVHDLGRRSEKARGEDMNAEQEIEAKAVGRRIRALRKAKGLSQKQLSAASGVPYYQLSRIECGTRPIRPGAISRLAIALGLTTDELLPDVKEALRPPRPAA